MIREMEYIYAIYCAKSFSQAARDLHISQPALSGMVKKVENSLNTPLFDRSVTPIALTQAGEYYISCAGKILQIKSEMDEYFKNLSMHHMSGINIGAPSFFCIYVLPDFIKEFCSVHPECQINLVELNASDMASHLLKGTLDMMVDVRKNFPEGIESITVYCESILLAVPSYLPVNNGLEKFRLTFDDIESGKHLKKSFPAVDMNHFRNESFMLLRKGHDMTQRAIAICGEAGFVPNVVGEFDQMLSSYRMVQNGRGIAFVRDGVPRHVSPTDDVVFYKVSENFFYRDLMLNYRKDKEFSPLALEFIKFLTSPERCWA